MGIFKKISLGVVSILAVFTLAVSAHAAVYNVADYMPMLNAAPTDERVYMSETVDPFATDPYTSTVYFERSAGILPARLTPTDLQAATVPTTVLRSSDGRDSLWTLDAAGLTIHGDKTSDPIQQGFSTSYNYDFIVAPANAAAATVADFSPANLTTPSALLPAVIDTAVQTVFVRSYASTGEGSFGAWADYMTETVTVDDNGGLLHDLSNPAHPDYDPTLALIWDAANGGTGIATLQGLLKLTVHSVTKSVTSSWSDTYDLVMYLAPGVGIVYSKSASGTWPGSRVEKLFGYNIAGLSGSIGGTGSALVQVQDMYGSPVSGGYVNAQQNTFDPYTGAVTTNYSAVSVFEETPGSGQYKVYFGAGDLLDVNYKGGGYMQETAPAQDLYALALASTPVPLIYTLTMPLGVVSGIVSDPAGLPLAGVTVELRDAYASPFVWSPPVRVTTDVSGFYTSYMDPYTVYDISVPTRIDNFNNTKSPNLPASLVGGVVDQYGQVVSGVSGSFSVLPAGVLPLNIQVAQGVAISGAVIDPAGLLVSGAKILVQETSNLTSNWLNTDSYGQYVATVLPGQYDIHILEGWASTGQLVAFTNFGVGGFIDPYGMTTQNWNNRLVYTAVVGTNIIANAQLNQGGDVVGIITDPLGLPVANAQVSLDGVSTTGWLIQTDVNGQYTVRTAPGQYSVQINSGQSPATGQPIALPNGSVAGYIDPFAKVTPDVNAAQLFNVSVAASTQANAQLSLGAAITTVSGTVTNVSGVGGPILVGIFLDPYATTEAAPGVVADPVTLVFNIAMPDGVYWVAAYVDVNGNFAVTGPDVNEPVTMSPVRVDIVGGAVAPISVNVVIDAVVDTDGDGVGDYWDHYPTNPNYALEADTDGDGIADVWEMTYFGNLTTANQLTDSNGNGVLDIQAFNAGSNPLAAALKPSFLGVDAAGPIMSVVDSTGVAVVTPVAFFNASSTSLVGVSIDIDGDGVNEYAVVAQRADGLIMCQVRRANGVLVKAFFVTASTQASVLNVYAAQMDAVAGEELVIGKVRSSDNRPVVSVHNPITGAKVMETLMLNGNWSPSNFFPVDVNGDGIKEIALGAVKSNGLTPSFIPVNRPGIQIRNADGTISGYVFPMSKDFTGVQYARIDRNGDGIDEIVALGLSVNSRWALQVLNASTAVQLSLNIILDTPYTPVSLLAGNVDGIIGDEVVIAASLTSNGRAMFDIRNTTSNARINLLYMQPAANAPDQYALSDWNGDGVQDLMVRGTNAGIPNYLIKRPDNTVIYNGMPVGISGVNERYTGGM